MRFLVDLHCHPSLKPYGRGYQTGTNNSSDPHDAKSIYFYDPPTLWDKILNITCTLTRFRQSDFTALDKSNVRVIAASLYPIERGFFAGKLGKGVIPDALNNFVSQVGQKRVDAIERISDYFSDLKEEFDFYRNLNDTKITVNDRKLQYKIVKNYDEIISNLGNATDNILSIILTIEGGHVFNSQSNQRAVQNIILQNIAQVKNWEFRPFFVSMSHHFYNEICGHESSLSKLMLKVLDQSHGLGTGFTDLGEAVLDALLDNTNGQRILIDVKHMSVKSRQHYYNYLDARPGDKIPIIVSHGAVNGKPSFLNPDSGQSEKGRQFHDGRINFYDDEIVKLARSEGLFCIQMDERRLTAKHTKGTALHLNRSKLLRDKAELVWNQIRYIAELLDAAGENGWKYTAIGSDYDGIVNPLNGYWTSEQYPLLEDNLLKFAEQYMKNSGKNLALQANREIKPDEIVNNFLQNNALEFLKKNFI